MIIRPKSIRIMIADPFPEFRNSLAMLLNNEEAFQVVGTVANGEEALQFIEEQDPHIAIIDLNLPRIDGKKMLELVRISDRRVSTQVILIAAELLSFSDMQELLRLGAREVSTKEEYEKIVDTIKVIYGNTFNRSLQPILSPVLRSDSEQIHKVQPRTIVVGSWKGGTGKSIIAGNLALCLAAHGHSVCLVDANFGQGVLDQHLKLQLSGKHLGMLFEEACPDIFDKPSNGRDPQIIRDHLIGYEDFGLQVILSPRNPYYGHFIYKDHIKWLAQELLKMFEFVIVDTAAEFNDYVLAWYVLGDPTLLVVDQEVSSILLTIKAYEILSREFDLPVRDIMEYVRPVYNKVADITEGIDGRNKDDDYNSPEYVQQRLGTNFLGVLPRRDRKVRESIDWGRPMFVSDPRGTFTKQMIKLAEAITGTPLLPVEARPQSLVEWAFGHRSTQPGIRRR